MRIFILLFLILLSQKIYSQDTINYVGYLKGRVVLESFEFFEDKTYKWTNEFDLLWSEYGKYSIESNRLILESYIYEKYPKTMTLKDSIEKTDKVIRKRVYELESDRLFLLDNNGNRILRTKDTFIRRRWDWLRFRGFEYIIKRN